MSVYLKAAKLVDSGKETDSIFAIIQASNSWNPVRRFNEHFKTQDDGFYYFGSYYCDKARNHRVIALILMHEIAKGEE